MKPKEVEILSYTEDLTSDFARLNLEWLEKYFYVEEYDKQVLFNPQEHIIKDGGQILFAKSGEEIAGTVALIRRGEDVFELSKMAVSESFQGLRIGQKLMYACIHTAGVNGIKKLILDSNTTLVAAINLYRKVGFKEIPVPEDTHYERSNIRMELNL